MLSTPRILDTDPRGTENSDSPIKLKKRLIRRAHTENDIMKQLNQLQYIDQIRSEASTRKSLLSRNRHKYIGRFIFNLREKTRSLSILTHKHYNLIGDKSSFYLKSNAWPIRKLNELVCFLTLYKLVLQLLKFFQAVDQTLPLMHPDKKYKIAWDCFAITSRLYFLYLIPLDLAWNNQSFIFEQFYDTTTVMLTILLLDLLMGFNTAYYEFGFVVTSRVKIIKHRLLNCLGLEWISIVMVLTYLIYSSTTQVDLNVNENSVHLILFTFLIHTKTNYDLIKHYEEGFNVSKKLSSIIQLCKFIVFLFYMLHLFSCLWWWVGQYSVLSRNQSWITVEVLEMTWYQQYLESLYYSSVTMFTVGYGDVIPRNTLEKAVSILFIMITSIQLPYSVSTVGTIIKEISAYGEEKARKLRLLNSFMHKRQINQELQTEIRQYLNYCWQLQNSQEQDENQATISQLSDSLKQKLMLESYSSMLNGSKFFKKFSQPLKQELVKQIRQVIYPPDALIDVTDQLTLCFIEQGEVSINVEAGRSIQLGTLSKGQTLGLQSFLSGVKAPEKYKSIGFANLYLLKRDDFIAIIRGFPTDFEKYCKMKDDIIFRNSSLIYGQCFSCQSMKHKLINCKLLHYVPDREAILKRFAFNSLQERLKYRRAHSKAGRYRFLNDHSNNQIIRLVQERNPEICNLYCSSYEGVQRLRKSRSIILLFQQRKIPSDRNVQVPPKKNLFQWAVRKVIIINMLKNKRRHRRFNPAVAQMIQLQQVHQRLKVCQTYPNMFSRELNQIELLLHKLSDRPAIDDQNFEAPKEFRFYEQRKNLYSMAPFTGKLKIGLLNKFIPYFLYPGMVIEKYGCKPQMRNIVNYKRRKNVILF